MPIKVTSLQKEHGLDANGPISWQMVPIKGSRTIMVTGTGGLTPYVRNPKLLKISSVGANFKLEGLAEGLTQIDWLSAPGAMAKPGFTLDVSVKKNKTVRTAFFYVDDGRKQKTVRQPGNINTLVSAVNNILTSQANITLKSKGAKVLKIKKNLGSVVRFSSHLKGVPKNQHEWDLLRAHSDKTADFNVFFVVEYEQDRTPKINNTNAGTIASQKMCIMDDNKSAIRSAITLAHEACHQLSKTPHTKKGLMGPDGAGSFLLKNQINAINPSGAK